MKLAAIRLALGIAAALATSAGPLASSTQAGIIPWAYESIFGTGGYGYGAGYAPAGYGYTAGYGGYGGGGGCCLSSLFHGCGLFGHGYNSYASYTPSYYQPSYYNPGCGSCGTGCGSCGSSASYSISGLGCDNGCGSGWNGTCASGNCGSLGCASGNCSSSDCISDNIISNSGSSIGPYSPGPVPVPDTNRPSSSSPGNPVLPNNNPSQPPNRTYREQPSGDGFQKPRQDPASGGGNSNPFGGGSGDTGGGLITPPTGGSAEPQSNPNFNLDNSGEQGLYKIPAKNHSEPQPTDEKPDQSQIVKPLDIETRVAFHTESTRARARYHAIFRTPSVTRTTVPTTGGWEPIHETKLAANK